MNFEESGYAANEDQLLQACVVLVGSIEVNVTLILSAEELSSLPENMRANGILISTSVKTFLLKC